MNETLPELLREPRLRTHGIFHDRILWVTAWEAGDDFVFIFARPWAPERLIGFPRATNIVEPWPGEGGIAGLAGLYASELPEPLDEDASHRPVDGHGVRWVIPKGRSIPPIPPHILAEIEAYREEA